MSDHERPTSQMLYLRPKGAFTCGIDLSKCNNHLRILQTGETVAVCNRAAKHPGSHIDDKANMTWEGLNNVNQSKGKDT